MEQVGYLLAFGLAIVHGLAAQIPIERLIPKFRWTSFAGGVSLAFVFLEIFPELSHAQSEIEHIDSVLLHYLENHVYILALIGLMFFYLLDAIVLKVRRLHPARTTQDFPILFWLHMAAFATLNLITGYLIQELSHHSLSSCLIFFAAIALHFFVIDEHLRHHHQSAYDRLGRWILVACIILGAVIGQTTTLNPLLVTVIWSFLAGSIILNVLKRELPDEQDSCVFSFLSGTLVFSGLLFLR
ncbi:MAG: hypothetical protein AAGB01_11315 [Cyanobacteria bacterium P01_F01_bin.42]